MNYLVSISHQTESGQLASSNNICHYNWNQGYGAPRKDEL